MDSELSFMWSIFFSQPHDYLFIIFQKWLKIEIEIDIEEGEKSSQLVDKEDGLSSDIKIEIDNAEEELIHVGEYFVFPHYHYAKHFIHVYNILWRDLSLSVPL